MKIDQIDKIYELIQPMLEGKDLFVVDIEQKGSAIPEIWVYLDKESTDIKIEECTEISRELGLLMEANDLFSKKYRLNVSSPGMSRPLTDPRQYPKHIGRNAKVRLFEDDEHTKSINVSGSILSVDERAVHLKLDINNEQAIPWANLIEFKIQPTF